MSFIAAAIGAVGAIGGSIIGGNATKSAAATNAAAAAQDQRQTEVSSETMQQLMQEIAKMDKSVAEKLFGTSNTTDIMNSLQQLTSQEQSTGSTTGMSSEQMQQQQSQQTQQQQAEQMQQQQTQQTQQQTIRGDAASNEALSSTLANLTAQFNTGGQANFDSAVSQVLRSGMPALSGVGNRAGTFGDTTTALLQNDLVTKAAEAGLASQQNNQAQLTQQMAQVAAALQAGKESTTDTGTSATTGTTTGTTTGATTGSTTGSTTGTTSGTTANTTNTNQTNNTQQQNQSNTQTTQDRTAQESSTNQTQQGTTAVSTNLNDSFIDFGKDSSMNASTILPTLGTVGTGVQQTVVGPNVTGTAPVLTNGTTVTKPTGTTTTTPGTQLPVIGDPSNPNRPQQQARAATGAQASTLQRRVGAAVQNLPDLNTLMAATGGATSTTLPNVGAIVNTPVTQQAVASPGAVQPIQPMQNTGRVLDPTIMDANGMPKKASIAGAPVESIGGPIDASQLAMLQQYANLLPRS